MNNFTGSFNTSNTEYWLLLHLARKALADITQNPLIPLSPRYFMMIFPQTGWEVSYICSWVLTKSCQNMKYSSELIAHLPHDEQSKDNGKMYEKPNIQCLKFFETQHGPCHVQCSQIANLVTAEVQSNYALHKHFGVFASSVQPIHQSSHTGIDPADHEVCYQSIPQWQLAEADKAKLSRKCISARSRDKMPMTQCHCPKTPIWGVNMTNAPKPKHPKHKSQWDFSPLAFCPRHSDWILCM